VTDNTYSLASPNRLMTEIVADEVIPELETHYFEDRGYWRLVYKLPTGGQLMITRQDSQQSPEMIAAQIRGAIRQATAKMSNELAEARSLLETIANSTEHADAAQKWECEKAELLATLHDLLDEIKRLCQLSTLNFLRARMRYSYTNAEKVIAKYEAK
jgi:hypothetical protein